MRAKRADSREGVRQEKSIAFGARAIVTSGGNKEKRATISNPAGTSVASVKHGSYKPSES